MIYPYNRLIMKSYIQARTYTIYYVSEIPGDIRHTMLDTYVAAKKRVNQLLNEGFTIIQISRITYEEVEL